MVPIVNFSVPDLKFLIIFRKIIGFLILNFSCVGRPPNFFELKTEIRNIGGFLKIFFLDDIIQPQT